MSSDEKDLEAILKEIACHEAKLASLDTELDELSGHGNAPSAYPVINADKKTPFAQLNGRLLQGGDLETDSFWDEGDDSPSFSAHRPDELLARIATAKKAFSVQPMAGASRPVALEPKVKESFENAIPKRLPTAAPREIARFKRLSGRFLVGGFAGMVVLFAAWAGITGHYTQRAAEGLTQQQPFQLANAVNQQVGVVESFLNAASLEERARYCWDGTRTKLLMERYYQTNPPPEVVPAEQIKQVGDTSGWLLSELPSKCSLVYALNAIGKASLYVIREQENASAPYLIDWEASIGYNETTVTDWVSKGKTAPVTLRAKASPSTYYNYAFSDSAKYWAITLEVTDPTQPPIAAFVDRDSSAYVSLSRLFADSGRSTYAVMVKAVLTGTKEEPLAEISDFIAPHWIAPRQPSLPGPNESKEAMVDLASPEGR